MRPPFRTTLDYTLEIIGEHEGLSKNTIHRAKLSRPGYNEPISVFLALGVTPRCALKTAAAHTIAAIIQRSGDANIATPDIYLHHDKGNKIDGYCTEALEFVADHVENRSISASPTPSTQSGISSTSSTSPSAVSAESSILAYSPRAVERINLESTTATQNLIETGLGFASAIRVGLRDTDGNGNLLFNEEYDRIGKIDFEFTDGRKRDNERFDLLNFQSCRLKRIAFLLTSPFLVSGDGQDWFNWMPHQGMASFPTQIGKLCVARPELLRNYLGSFLQGIRHSIQVFKCEGLEAVIIASLGIEKYLDQNPELHATLNIFVAQLRNHNQQLEALLTRHQNLDNEELETLTSHFEDYFATQGELNRSIETSNEKAPQEEPLTFARWLCDTAFEIAQTHNPVNAFALGRNGIGLFHVSPERGPAINNELTLDDLMLEPS